MTTEKKRAPLKEKAKINSRQSLLDWCQKLVDWWDEYHYINVTASDQRSLAQNALKSVWYKDIADRLGDRTAKDVERECKLVYGIPILRRDSMNNWVYERSLDKLRHEKQLMLMDSFAVTSQMSVTELKEYLDTMQNDYPYLECKQKE